MSPPSLPAGGTGKDSTFSRIIAGKLPAKWVVNHPTSPVVCFHNRLKWARVMLLVVPRDYMTQEELWQGDILQDAMKLAVEVGEKHCPEGFRIISNFGRGAHQSQLHAHIHVVSDLARNIDEAEPIGEWQQRGRVKIRQHDVQSAPYAELYRDDTSVSQYEFLTGEGVKLAAEAAISHAKQSSPTGFRLKANYTNANRNSERGGDPGLFMLGGGQLSLYV
jgi:diadenosine tetraphosphate (Ap4A) HIT family hydrolase